MASASLCTRASPAATMRPPVRRGLALPGGDAPAGAFDDRHQGHHVVGLQPGLDDQVDEAARPAGNRHSNPRRSGSCAPGALRRWKASCSPGAENMSGCVVVSTASARRGAGPCLERPGAPPRVELRALPPAPQKRSPVKGWFIRPSDGLAAVQQADQRAPKRRADDEGARAVDRVDHPIEAALRPRPARTPRRRCHAAG